MNTYIKYRYLKRKVSLYLRRLSELDTSSNILIDIRRNEALNSFYKDQIINFKIEIIKTIKQDGFYRNVQ